MKKKESHMQAQKWQNNYPQTGYRNTKNTYSTYRTPTMCQVLTEAQSWKGVYIKGPQIMLSWAAKLT